MSDIKPWASIAANVLNFAEFISDDEWQVYRDALEALQAKHLPFALGGGYAFSAYAHRWRDTKDLDLYILAQDREAVIAALEAAGFKDYFSQGKYDRSWSYRGFRNDIIVDALWGIPRHRARVDEGWLATGPALEIRGLIVRLLPVEQLLRAKLYVINRERCDWPDLLNILYVQGPAVNWRFLFDLLDEDRQVLAALMTLFAWLCPRRAGELPGSIWSEMGLSRPTAAHNAPADGARAVVVAEGDWFGPTVPVRENAGAMTG